MPQHEDRPTPKPHPDQEEDLLSPSRALRESAARRPDGPRVGDSGPLANPEVSFPDEPADEAPDRRED
jgi:hypothetical protein